MPRLPTADRDDPVGAERRRILATVFPEHVAAFNAMRAELKSTVPVMQPVGDNAERMLANHLRTLPSLDGALEACRHVLAVRVAEARVKRTLKYLGASVWHPVQFDFASRTTPQEIAAADGDRAGPKRGGDGLEYLLRRAAGEDA